MVATSNEIKRLLASARESGNKLSLCDDNSKIVIYGAGVFGKEVFQILTNHGFHVLYFLDQKAKAGDFWENVPVVYPGNETYSLSEKNAFQVVIALFNRDTPMIPIVQKLKGLGYENFITVIDLFDFFNQDLGDRLWATCKSHYETLEEDLVEIDQIWADQTSQNLFRSVLEFRLNGNYALLPEPDLQNQYFPPDLPGWRSPIRFVDCGAYNGDTIINLLNSKLELESIAAFEPDLTSFHELAVFSARLNLKDTFIWPCAVFSKTTMLNFSDGFGEASKISTAGNSLVQAVALDEVIPNFQPSLIKMDIEGAEYDALLGARRLIHTYRPGLAISLYHQPDHLVRIPKLILGWGCGYKYFLRSHAYSDFDLIFYAVSN